MDRLRVFPSGAPTASPPPTPGYTEKESSEKPRLLVSVDAFPANRASDGPPGGTARSHRAALDVIGTVTIIAGSLISLGVLSFLLLLWTGEGDDGGASASAAWRWIVVPERLAQTITISSAILRISSSLQAILCTSLIAAMLLENYGVPLFRVAEVSTLRSVNNGPLGLARLLLGSRSLRSSALLPILLVAVLALTNLASQFTSTILLTDLFLSPITGDQQTSSTVFEMDIDTTDRWTYGDALTTASVFTPFAEISGMANTTVPSDTGVSDTGIVQRAFLPMEEARRKVVRNYRGKGFVYSSRWLCMPPTLSNTSMRVSESVKEQALIDVAGTLSLAETFTAAGMSYAPNCTTGTCTTSDIPFNCTLPTFDVEYDSAEHPIESLSACTPNVFLGNDEDGTWVSNLQPTTTPDLNFTRAWIFFSADFTSGSIGENTSFPVNGIFPFPEGSIVRDESVIWELDTYHVSASVCFMQVSIDVADIAVTANRDLLVPEPSWDIEKHIWNTTGVTTMFGLNGSVNGLRSPDERGLYSVEQPPSGAVSNNYTTDIVSYMLGTSYGDFTNSEASVNIMLSTGCTGLASFLPEWRTLAVFEEIIHLTGRPAIALSNLMSTLAGMQLLYGIPQLAIGADAAVVSSVKVLAPRQFRGLLTVVAIVLTNLSTTVLTAALFRRRTRHSRQGNYWSTAAQVVSDETRWILDEAAEMSDDAVETMLGSRGAAHVVVSRSLSHGGRVEVMKSTRWSS